MSFDYNVLPANQTVYTPGAKGVMCKSFKIDLAAANAGTGVATLMGYLPKDSQVVAGTLFTTTAVSGPSVSAATLTLSVNGANIMSAVNVFATGASNSLNSAYMGAFPTPTLTDAPVRFTLTLTGGATATAGVIWINLLYVA